MQMMTAAAAATVLIFSPIAFAQQGGTAQEARAMLDKAVAALKADQEVALAMFHKGEGGFRDRELYPFCSRIRDGKNVAGPLYAPAGTDGRTLKDSTGKAYGVEQLDGATQRPEGEVFEVSYRAPKPGTTAPEFQRYPSSQGWAISPAESATTSDRPSKPS